MVPLNLCLYLDTFFKGAEKLPFSGGAAPILDCARRKIRLFSWWFLPENLLSFTWYFHKMNFHPSSSWFIHYKQAGPRSPQLIHVVSPNKIQPFLRGDFTKEADANSLVIFTKEATTLSHDDYIREASAFCVFTFGICTVISPMEPLHFLMFWSCCPFTW